MTHQHAYQHAYERIAADLRADMDTGRLMPGDKLPSMSQLRERYGVSDTVVRNALLVLRVEGRTETRHGAGVFVRAPGTDETPVIGLGGPPCEQSDS